MPVNPFRYSAPVGGDDLVGRDVELEQLLRTAEVGAGHSASRASTTCSSCTDIDHRCGAYRA